MKQYFYLLFVALIHWLVFFDVCHAQIRLGDSPEGPNASAVLELASTGKGFLPPRMTTEQRDAIAEPSPGLTVYNTTLACLQVYTSGTWTTLAKVGTPEVYPPRLTIDQIEALPSPQPGDLAYDLTTDCLRYYNGTQWLCSNKKPGEPAITGTAWRAGGASGTTTSSGIAVDGSGNIYITGYYLFGATFGETTLEGFDAFVAKYTSAGQLQWVQKIGGDSYDYGNGITVDKMGNVYAVGQAAGQTLTFGDKVLTTTSTSGIAYLAKFTTDGVVEWARVVNGESSAGVGVTADEEGNVYITGGYSGNATFDTKTISSNAGSYDVFIAKYSADGICQWVTSGGGRDSDRGIHIAVDKHKNVYATGFFQNQATFGGTTLSPDEGQDIFLAKYNAEGVLQWVRKAGGSYYEESGNALAVSDDGSIYLTGSFGSTATFGSFQLTAAGMGDIFVARYTPEGEVAWVKKGGGTALDSGRGIVLDKQGNVCVAGTLYGPLSFDGKEFKFPYYPGAADIFLARFKPDGTLLSFQFEGGGANDNGYSMAIDSSGAIHLTGTFEKEALFGGTYLKSAGNSNIFVLKYDE